MNEELGDALKRAWNASHRLFLFQDGHKDWCDRPQGGACDCGLQRAREDLWDALNLACDLAEV